MKSSVVLMLLEFQVRQGPIEIKETVVPDLDV